MENLNLSQRSDASNHNARKVRREGKVPGVMYGAIGKSFLFEVSQLELDREISELGEHGLINVTLDGTQYKTLIKEIQREPLNHKIVHIDLEALNGNEKVNTEIPIKFINEDIVKKQGGIIQKEKSSIKVRCAANNIPSYIPVDLGKTDIGMAIKISDVEFGSEIFCIDDKNSVLAAIGYGGNTGQDEVDEI